MSIEKLKSLQIEPQFKRRSGNSFRLIILGIVGVLGSAAFMARPWEHDGQRIMRAGSVTASLTADFVDGAREGELIEARGEVVRATGSMVFLRGLVTAAGRPLLNFTAIIKKIRRRG